MSKTIIDKLQLKPHVEGGYYRSIYRSDVMITKNDRLRPASSAVYYYLDSNDFSAWHRVDCDEMWHYYIGSHLTLHMIDSSGKLTCVKLGHIDSSNDVVPQCLVPAGTWQSAEVSAENSYALMGCTCTPGFLFEQHEMPDSNKLIEQFPMHENIIKRLTRDSHD